MRRLLASAGIALAIGCGGRAGTPDLDAGAGASGAGGSTATGGTGGASVGGAGGATTGGTGGATVGGVGGATGGTGGATGGTGGTTTVGGTGGTIATGGAGGLGGAGGVAGNGGTGGAPITFNTCTGHGQCELLPSQCCACGPLGLNQMVGVNVTKRAEYSVWSCGPNPAPCPPCAPIVDPYLIARCETDICRGFDIRTDPTFTKCGTDQDCMLRRGLGCCECNNTGEWVAISKVGNMVLTSQVCGPNSVCPGCIPTPPITTVAVCSAGSCVVRILPK